MGACCSALVQVNEPSWTRWGDHPVRADYEVLQDLGEGAFSLVALCRRKSDGKLMALKIVYLQSPDMLAEPEHCEIMQREAVYLQKLSHPNIVKCEGVENNGKQMVIILEFLRGGQLFDQLEALAGEHYTEQQASSLFAQMASALQYMHSFGIMHRDIKGENFIFAQSPAKAAAAGNKPIIKLIDLGMSAQYEPKRPIKGALGSPGFVSPEVVRNRAHTPAMDVYSLGVVLFVMVVGRKPFSLRQCETLAYGKLPIEEAPGLQDSRYQHLSDSLKDLLLFMLKSDPQARLTSEQVLQHPWVAACGGATSRRLSLNAARGAANTAAARRFRHLVHGIAADTSMRPLPRGRQPAPDDDEGTVHSYTSRLKKQQQAAAKSRGYRGDPSGKPLSREDTANYVSQSQRYADSHDKGKAIDSMQDISRHVRHHKDRSIHGGASQHSKASASSESSRGRAYYSIHGGRLRFEDPGDDNDSSSKGDISSQGSEKTVRGGSDAMRHSLSASDLRRQSSTHKKWRRWGLGVHSNASPPSSPGSSMHQTSISSMHGQHKRTPTIQEHSPIRSSTSMRRVNVLKPL